MKKQTKLPIPVNKALQKLGADLKEARIKRRLTMALVEERAGITHVTLTKVEKGDAGVSIGIYTKVMFVLGLIDNVYNLAEPDNDVVGKMYDKENLPKRVYYTREEKKNILK